jgi:DNA-binding transcriptional regulator WhiA
MTQRRERERKVGVGANSDRNRLVNTKTVYNIIFFRNKIENDNSKKENAIGNLKTSYRKVWLKNIGNGRNLKED